MMYQYRVVKVRPKCWRIFYGNNPRAVDLDFACRPLSLVRARCKLMNGDLPGYSVLGDYGGSKIKYGKRFAQPR